MGNTSLNTRSSPTSARSAPLPSGCNSDWNARVWMSRRCGIGIPWSSLANDSTGSVFVMSRPQANAKGPAAPTGTPAGEGPRGSCKRAGVWQIRACRRPKKTRESRRRARVARRVSPPPCLLQFDDRALCFELLFDLVGFLLGHAFLHRAGRAFHQVLGLLQAQAGDRPDFLDDLNLLLPATLEDDRELGLLLGRRGRGRSTTRAARRGRRRHRRRDRHAELPLELLDQLGEFHDRQAADGFDDIVDAHTRLRRHCPDLLMKPRPWSAGSGAPRGRSEEHTSELQSLAYLVCRLLLEKKKNPNTRYPLITPAKSLTSDARTPKL